MATTPNFKLRYYAGTDIPAGMTQQANLANDVEAALTAGTDIRRVANSSAYPTSPVVGQRVDDAALGGTLRWNGTIWVPIDTDTGFLPCGGGNSSVTGTAQVQRVGKQINGKINLTCSGGWPTSQITAFTLPDTSFAPGGPQRMNMGGPFQATAGSVFLLANSGSTAAFAGANGSAGSVMQWNGPLWVTS